MIMLLTGLVVFFGIHLLPTVPGLRDKLTGVMGEPGYKILFAVVALCGLLLIVYGKASAGHDNLWQPPLATVYIALVLMFCSIFSLVSAALPSFVNKITPHPMLWGVVFWSVSHLSTNGDVASIITFGSFLVYSIIAMISLSKRGKIPEPVDASIGQNILVLVIATAIYLGLIFFHTALFGMAALMGMSM